MVCGATGGKTRRRGRGFAAAPWLVLLALLGWTQGAQAECYDQGICIETRAQAGVTALLGINRNAFPVTLNLTLELDGVTSANSPGTRVVPPGAAVPLARLWAREEGASPDYEYRFNWSRGDYRARRDRQHLYSLPYRADTGGAVTQSYGGDYSHTGDTHYAVDFAMPVGTPLLAARAGRVVAVREDSTVGGADRRYIDAANYVVIQHADGTFGEYLHLAPDGARVEPGEHVRRGQLIGRSGNTGFSSGPHLHFGVTGVNAAGDKRSFPVRFRTRSGVVAEPERGRRYESPQRVAREQARPLRGLAGLNPAVSARLRPIAAGGSDAPKGAAAER